MVASVFTQWPMDIDINSTVLRIESNKDDYVRSYDPVYDVRCGDKWIRCSTSQSDA